MKFPYLSIFISLILALVAATHALPLGPELYWKSKLPTTQMPKAITDLLHPSNANGKILKPDCLTLYYRAANETQLHENPNISMFFLEKDLHHGTKLNLHFMKTSNYGATFLPREIANSIPFSSSKVENILNHFSIKQGSKESEFVKHTIGYCEVQDMKGEVKNCVTSLESMVDFATLKLGNNVEAVSTEVNKEKKLQEYVIAKGVKKLGEDNEVVVCHKVNYPYAVFYCHKIDATNAYSVPLEGVDGSRVKAVVVCHTDTSQWHPEHFAFELLKVQRGTVPICHFFTQEHVVWVSKYSKFNLGQFEFAILDLEDDDVKISK